MLILVSGSGTLLRVRIAHNLYNDVTKMHWFTFVEWLFFFWWEKGVCWIVKMRNRDIEFWVLNKYRVGCSSYFASFNIYTYNIFFFESSVHHSGEVSFDEQTLLINDENERWWQLRFNFYFFIHQNVRSNLFIGAKGYMKRFWTKFRRIKIGFKFKFCYCNQLEWKKTGHTFNKPIWTTVILIY